MPNFCEGNDLAIIQQITNAVESVEGVRSINVNPATCVGACTGYHWRM